MSAVPPRATDLDPARFRSVLGHFPTGVTIITSPGPHGFTIGSFTSVSLDPPMVGFLPQVSSETWTAMAATGVFCVNVLTAAQADLCWRFAKSGTDATRFDGVDWRPAPSGAPIIAGSLGWIDCRVAEVHRMGDHFFVLGAVTALEAEGDDPLLFFRGRTGHFRPEG